MNSANMYWIAVESILNKETYSSITLRFPMYGISDYSKMDLMVFESSIFPRMITVFDNQVIMPV